MTAVEQIKQFYNPRILTRWLALVNSDKQTFDNKELAKIFELYTCVKLTELYGTAFYEYGDIVPNFKEVRKMSRNDTGIDVCNLDDTIVQCKLRSNSLTYKECATFFASAINTNEDNELCISWKKLFIVRNSDSTLSPNLANKKTYTDITFDKEEMFEYCKQLQCPTHDEIETHTFSYQPRKYQDECKKLIKDNPLQNIVVALPTGSGKNSIIINSIIPTQQSLVLVPTIILMHQLYNDFKKYKPELTSFLQRIGDGNNVYDKQYKITICVYNSIVKIPDDALKYMDRIYVDEAHRINKPMIYCMEDDDNEDKHDEGDTEEGDTKTYLDKIQTLIRFNNNVYLSATIDKIDGWLYFHRDIRYMIENEYLCDYDINVPVFSSDPTLKNVCKYLIHNHESIIVYCSSRKEGKNVCNLLNEIQANSASYIDCHTSKKQRKELLNNYSNGHVKFLVNVYVLVEGFDAPITKGVCILSMPSSSTTIIQIIGRSLRLHHTKKIAHVILPYLKNEESKDINFFIRALAQNDSRIKQSYTNKTLGGYINIESTDNEVEETDVNYNLMYTNIYDSLGMCTNRTETFYKNLERLKSHLDKYNKKPSKRSENAYEKKIGTWFQTQRKNYKNKKDNMKNNDIYDAWTTFTQDNKYIKFCNNDNWYGSLDVLKSYLDKYNKKPSYMSEKKIGMWFERQRANYKNKKYNMKNNDIYDAWTTFTQDNKYIKFCKTNNDIWYESLDVLKSYLDKYNKKPYKRSKNAYEKKIGTWFQKQRANYKNKKYNMKNNDIYDAWTTFTQDNKYTQYF